MPDVTVKHIDEMDAINDGAFVRARGSLGVTAWGMNVENLPPHHEGYPEHDHLRDGQEEVYVPLEGSATLVVAGEEYALTPGTFARVGPAEKRKILPGADGVRLLCLGGTPGKVFEP